MRTVTPLGFALAISMYSLISMTAAYAQIYHQGGDPLTQEQKDYCAKYQIDPCTQNNILERERIVTYDGGENAHTHFQQLQMSDWLIIGIGVGSIIAIAAVAFVALKMKRTTHIDNV